jgi:hypothetical protein
MTAGLDDSIRSVGSSSTACSFIEEANENILEITQMDYNTEGDGGDSDEESDGFEIANSMATALVHMRNEYMIMMKLRQMFLIQLRTVFLQMRQQLNVTG